MVLRADPGVTLPGLILGSSINWCMAWGELLLSSSLSVMGALQEYLAVAMRIIWVITNYSSEQESRKPGVASSTCAEWPARDVPAQQSGTVAKKVHLSYFDASVGSGLSRYGLLWSWGVRRSVCPGLRLPSAFLLQPGYISSGVAAWPLGVGADMAEPQAGQWGAALCPAKSLLLALAPPAPKAAPCAYHCSVCAWGRYWFKK